MCFIFDLHCCDYGHTDQEVRKNNSLKFGNCPLNTFAKKSTEPNFKVMHDPGSNPYCNHLLSRDQGKEEELLSLIIRNCTTNLISFPFWAGRPKYPKIQSLPAISYEKLVTGKTVDIHFIKNRKNVILKNLD
jgi:hypothetical protein